MWRLLILACALLIVAYFRQHEAAAPPEAPQQASASQTDGGGACRGEVLDGIWPRLPRKMLPHTFLICTPEYVALASGLTKTGLWSAERLDAARIRAARQLPRIDDFHAEPTIPYGDRAELADYRHSGYDRGHLSPSEDFDAPQDRDMSFSLGQMIPQAPGSNRFLWEDIEIAVRDLAEDDDVLYVVTGPLFVGDSFPILNGRVYVPTEIFKAVYDPRRQTAGVYVALNASGKFYRIMSDSAFAATTGIDPFPSLPQQIKDTNPNLPPPRDRHRY